MVKLVPIEDEVKLVPLDEELVRLVPIDLTPEEAGVERFKTLAPEAVKSFEERFGLPYRPTEEWDEEYRTKLENAVDRKAAEEWAKTNPEAAAWIKQQGRGHQGDDAAKFYRQAKGLPDLTLEQKAYAKYRTQYRDRTKLLDFDPDQTRQENQRLTDQITEEYNAAKSAATDDLGMFPFTYFLEQRNARGQELHKQLKNDPLNYGRDTSELWKEVQDTLEKEGWVLPGADLPYVRDEELDEQQRLAEEEANKPIADRLPVGLREAYAAGSGVFLGINDLASSLANALPGSTRGLGGWYTPEAFESLRQDNPYFKRSESLSGQVAGDLGQVAGQLTATLALTRGVSGTAGAVGLGPNAGATLGNLAGMGLMGNAEGQSAYRSIKESLLEQGIDEAEAEKRALYAGVGVGTVNSLLERIPIGKFANRGKATSRLAGAFEGFIAEGGTEAAQEFVNVYAEILTEAQHNDPLAWDNLKRILYAGVLGGGIGLPTGALTAGNIDPQVLRKQQKQIDDIIKTARTKQQLEFARRNIQAKEDYADFQAATARLNKAADKATTAEAKADTLLTVAETEKANAEAAFASDQNIDRKVRAGERAEKKKAEFAQAMREADEAEQAYQTAKAEYDRAVGKIITQVDPVTTPRHEGTGIEPGTKRKFDLYTDTKTGTVFKVYEGQDLESRIKEVNEQAAIVSESAKGMKSASQQMGIVDPNFMKIAGITDKAIEWFSPRYSYMRPEEYSRRVEQKGAEETIARQRAIKWARKFGKGVKAAGYDLSDRATAYKIEGGFTGRVPLTQFTPEVQDLIKEGRVLQDKVSAAYADSLDRVGLHTKAATIRANIGKYVKSIPEWTLDPAQRLKRKFTGFKRNLRTTQAFGTTKKDAYVLQGPGKKTVGKFATRAAAEAAKAAQPNPRRFTILEPRTQQERYDEDVHDPRFTIVSGIAEAVHDAQILELYKYIGDNLTVPVPPGLTKSQIEEWAKENGLVALPKSGTYHNLQNAYVPKHIAEDLTELSEIATGFAAFLQGFNRIWKKGVVVYNPGSWGRDLLGNSFFFAPLARITPTNPRNWKHYIRGMQDVFAKGDKWEEAVRAGAIENEYYHAEIKQLRDFVTSNPDVGVGGILAKLGQIDRTVGKAYGFKDQFFKMAAYTKYRSEGMTAEEAGIEVNRWFPNYNKVGKITEWLRRVPLGFPFASFFDQSVRITGRALLGTNPHTGQKTDFKSWKGWNHRLRLVTVFAMPGLMNFIGKMLAGISDDEDAILRSKQPGFESYFTPYLPTRDSKGMPLVMDFRYIIPLANDILPRITDGGAIQIPWLFSGPLATAFIETMSGHDSFSGREFKTTEERIGNAAWDLAPLPGIVKYGSQRIGKSLNPADEYREDTALAILSQLGVNTRRPYTNEEAVIEVAAAAYLDGDPELGSAIVRTWNERFRPFQQYVVTDYEGNEKGRFNTQQEAVEFRKAQKTPRAYKIREPRGPITSRRVKGAITKAQNMEAAK